MSASKPHQHGAVLPGDHDDPDSASSGYWMALLGVFTLFSVFALAYLSYEFTQMARYGDKAPSGQSSLDRLNAAQDAELTGQVRGDLVHVGGQVYDQGKAVKQVVTEGEGPEAMKREMVVIVDARGNAVRTEAGPLQFPADQARVEAGKGKLLRVPLAAGKQRFLEAYAKGGR
jgi:hypothetical protein